MIGPTLILVAKHYIALKYTKEDEEEPIAHLQRPKKTRKRTVQIPSIPSIGVNLVAVLSQMEIPHVEEERVQEQAYSLTQATREGGIPQNDVHENEQMQKLVTSQPNLQDQQFTKEM